MRFSWVKTGAAWQAHIDANVTLHAGPDRTTGVLGDKPARGTTWRASVSTWDAATRTIARFGRDCYRETCSDAKSAKALAESIYLAAVAEAVAS